MNAPPLTKPYKRHRFPAEFICQSAWLYCRFCLSYRDVGELMAERVVMLTYEAGPVAVASSGQPMANRCVADAQGLMYHETV